MFKVAWTALLVGSLAMAAASSLPGCEPGPNRDQRAAVQSPTKEDPTVTTQREETAIFGAGCFWGVEHIFEQQVPGVIDAVSGYSGGRTKNPTYKQICEGDTGHVEVVRVRFDPSKVSFEELVDTFFRLHDPTQVDGQGPDIGEQYRSVIFYSTPEQKAIAEKVKERRAPKHRRPIATRIEPAQEFYVAEEYHQQYYVRIGKTPYCHVLRPD